MTHTVSVIIPTIAVKERADEIERAIRSALDQGDVDVRPILVVNGARFDPALVARLKADPRVDVVQIAEGNVSRARHAGVVHSDRAFFAFLDDDDELLPGAIPARLALFDEGDDVDLVVSNGFFRSAAGVDSVIVPKDVTDRIETEPLAALMDYNWFSAASGLFRAASFPASFFDFDYRYYECTWIGLSILDQRKKIRFCDTFGFRMHQGTPGSATKTKDYYRAGPAFIRRMGRFRNFGDDFARRRRKKLHHSLNLLSLLEREWGHYGRAWHAHLRCLAAGGVRFLPYTRHLLKPRKG